MAGVSFRGTGVDQDFRFDGKQSKLLKAIMNENSEEYSIKINISKVNKQLLEKFVSRRLTELMQGVEDDITINMVIHQLYDSTDGNYPSPAALQLLLTPILTKNIAQSFTREVWERCKIAMENPLGIFPMVLPTSTSSTVTTMTTTTINSNNSSTVSTVQNTNSNSSTKNIVPPPPVSLTHPSPLLVIPLLSSSSTSSTVPLPLHGSTVTVPSSSSSLPIPVVPSSMTIPILSSVSSTTGNVPSQGGLSTVVPHQMYTTNISNVLPLVSSSILPTMTTIDNLSLESLTAQLLGNNKKVLYSNNNVDNHPSSVHHHDRSSSRRDRSSSRQRRSSRSPPSSSSRHRHHHRSRSRSRSSPPRYSSHRSSRQRSRSPSSYRRRSRSRSPDRSSRYRHHRDPYHRSSHSSRRSRSRSRSPRNNTQRNNYRDEGSTKRSTQPMDTTVDEFGREIIKKTVDTRTVSATVTNIKGK